MNKDVAMLVLECFLQCPVFFGDGVCIQTEDSGWCDLGCWNKKEVKEAIILLLKDQKSAVPTAIQKSEE